MIWISDAVQGLCGALLLIWRLDPE